MPQGDNSTHIYNAGTQYNELYIHFMYIVHAWIECIEFAPKSKCQNEPFKKPNWAEVAHEP